MIKFAAHSWPLRDRHAWIGHAAVWMKSLPIMDPNSNGLWLTLGSTLGRYKNIIFQSSYSSIFRAPFFVLFVLLFSKRSLLQRLGQTQTIYLVIPPQQGSICILR